MNKGTVLIETGKIIISLYVWRGQIRYVTNRFYPSKKRADDPFLFTIDHWRMPSHEYQVGWDGFVPAGIYKT